MKTLKNGKSLALSLTVGKCVVHVFLLKAADICLERAWLQTRDDLKDITYTTPARDLCKGLAKQVDMKSAFLANFGLQTQLLRLLSSHKAWLQCQLGWGQSPTFCRPRFQHGTTFHQEWNSFTFHLFRPGARTMVIASQASVLWGLLATLLPLTKGPSNAPCALQPGNMTVYEIPNTL